MSNKVNQFVITKGSDNNFIFTIKKNGTTLPMVIKTSATADTFAYKIVKISDKTTALSGFLTVEDATNGKIKLTIASADANTLISGVGAEVDRYYMKPTYKLIIECTTDVNGDFIAKVDEVYVD